MRPYRSAEPTRRAPPTPWWRRWWHRVEHRFGWQKGNPITWWASHRNCEPSWMCPGPLPGDEDTLMVGFECATCGEVAGVHEAPNVLAGPRFEG